MFDSPFMNFGADPATMARLSTMMSGNPDLAKEMMVGLGIPPPIEGGSGGLGAALAGTPTPVAGTVLGQPPAGIPMPQAGASPPAGGMPNMQEISNIFRGVQPPKAPQPEMRAGVSGSQNAMQGKPPQVKTGELDLLMQMIGGGARQNPLVVPPLGALLGGRR